MREAIFAKIDSLTRRSAAPSPGGRGNSEKIKDRLFSVASYKKPTNFGGET